MSPPTSARHVTRVALFCTSRTPFSRSWIKKVCKQAQDGSEASPPEDPDRIRLVRIPGNFSGYTPLQLARRYVVPVLARESSRFASQSYVVADDQTHIDVQLAVVSIDPDYWWVSGTRLMIKGTLRIEASMAIDLPVIFHGGHQYIVQYGSDDYDNEAEPDESQELGVTPRFSEL